MVMLCLRARLSGGDIGREQTAIPYPEAHSNLTKSYETLETAEQQLRKVWIEQFF